MSSDFRRVEILREYAQDDGSTSVQLVTFPKIS
jgi:hypothetical protein